MIDSELKVKQTNQMSVCEAENVWDIWMLLWDSF